MLDRRALAAAALFLALVGIKLYLPELAERVLPPLQAYIDRAELALPEGISTNADADTAAHTDIAAAIIKAAAFLNLFIPNIPFNIMIL